MGDAAARIAGAHGAVCRYEDPVLRVELIRAVARGNTELPSLRPDGARIVADLLEDRDRPIIAMLVDGIHRDEICRSLGISASAFTCRRREILRKLDASIGGDRSGTPGL